MAAALRATEGGGYIFPKFSGGMGKFKIFPARGGIPPTPPIPDPWLQLEFSYGTMCSLGHICTSA